MIGGNLIFPSSLKKKRCRERRSPVQFSKLLRPWKNETEFCNARISRDRSRAHFECRPQTFTRNLDQKLKLFLCILISSELISFQTRFSFERIDIAGMGHERIGRFCDSTYILEQFLENSLTPMSKFSLQFNFLFNFR